MRLRSADITEPVVVVTTPTHDVLQFRHGLVPPHVIKLLGHVLKRAMHRRGHQ